MTNLQQLQNNIKNILIELTNITGFDHSSKSLEAFAICEDNVKSMVQKAYNLGQQDMLERVKGVIPKEYSDDIKCPDCNSSYFCESDCGKGNDYWFNRCREETLKALDNLN